MRGTIPETLGDGWQAALASATFAEEISLLEQLGQLAPPPETGSSELAAEWVAHLRQHTDPGLAAELLRIYPLSQPEGVLLLRLAEALERIPDAATRELLLSDLIADGDWSRNATSLLAGGLGKGLALSQRLLGGNGGWLDKLSRSGIRKVAETLSRQLAQQFVGGSSIAEVLARGAPEGCYSFDCLGEAALTATDARRYLEQYLDAIAELREQPADSLYRRHGLSIKLSALHPRFEALQRQRVHAELAPLVHELALAARSANIPLTIDSEEAERLELTLELFSELVLDKQLAAWDGLGLAVQAYQKRAPWVIARIADLCRQRGAGLAVRLVKGAYWDGELKRAQQQGWPDYPVYTRKTHTDSAYLACAELLLRQPAIYPQFATHNAYSLAWALRRARQLGRAVESQRLHGMGETLHQLAGREFGFPCRIYLPIGDNRELLPYLVRRLLENGANSSFVHEVHDPALSIDHLVADPRLHQGQALPPPAAIYPGRRNSAGLPLFETATQGQLLCAWRQLSRPAPPPWADAARVEQAFAEAQAAWPAWDALGWAARATMVNSAADSLEAHAAHWCAQLVAEGYKTWADALGEVREAIDLCRYYALCATEQLGQPLSLPGPVGEDNQLHWHGRGVFVALSPWNFPLAIFLGQVLGALLAGNAVLAKPAAQTPCIAQHALELLWQAGVPRAVLQLLHGSSTVIGNALLDHPALSGVVLTGSTQTAKTIQRRLAAREGAILPLIAETGGLNALIADSSALPEQLVQDVLISAFNSAGQRCSALRILFVHHDIAARVETLLAGALQQLRVGPAHELATDVGPVIDAAAQETLLAYCSSLVQRARLIGQAPLPVVDGCFVAPQAWAMNWAELPRDEVFGPILHVVRWRNEQWSEVIAWINNSGYGLTLGLHSRLPSRWRELQQQARVGNLYINRTQIGAVVGSQPFGGEGLSGTGFKAGGPHYLLRFAVERAVSHNTAAAGGNASLWGQAPSRE